MYIYEWKITIQSFADIYVNYCNILFYCFYNIKNNIYRVWLKAPWIHVKINKSI